MPRLRFPGGVIHTSPADDRAIGDAARLIRSGALVAFPTETVYGLGADATSPEAVSRLYAAKDRPRFNPLIAHVAKVDQARREGLFTPEAERLAEVFWPGPLTLVLVRHFGGSVCDLARAGLATVALRIPFHPLALALLEAVGGPVAAPSANLSGRLSPTRAMDVATALGGRVDTILDGGPCAIGVESTIVACVDGRISILRAGGITGEAVEAVVARPLDAPGGSIAAPGMLASHYAPSATVRLNAASLREGETGLDFGRRLGGGTLDLSPSADLTEAAAHLYAYLRRLDNDGASIIAVAPLPERGIGAAINDRLRRAAAPRNPSR